MALSDMFRNRMSSRDTQSALTPDEQQWQQAMRGQQSLDFYNRNEAGNIPMTGLPSLYGGGQGNGYLASNRFNTVFTGLPEAPTLGPGYTPNRNNAPVYSSLAGVNTAMANSGDSLFGGSVRRQVAPQVLGGTPDEALKQTLQSANSGGMQRGVQAFLGDFNPWGRETGPDGESRLASNAGASYSALRNLASISGINPAQFANSEAGMRQLYDRVNDATKDYYMIGGLSNGWTKSPNARGASQTLYKDVNGKLVPVTKPRNYVAAETGGDMLKGLVQDLSMVLPAFGGWAGLLGTGTAGTLSAGAGLGLTSGLSSAIGTGATNALINAGMNAAMGGGVQGGLSSLFSSGLGAATNSLFGNSGGLGQMFQNVGDVGTRVNPMGYYNSFMRNAGLGGSPLSSAVNLAGNAGRVGSVLSRLWS